MVFTPLRAANSPNEGGRELLKHKFALFYVLIASLCFVTFFFVLFHGFGYRVNRSDSLPGHLYRIVRLTEDEPVQRDDRVLIDISKASNTHRAKPALH